MTCARGNGATVGVHEGYVPFAVANFWNVGDLYGVNDSLLSLVDPIDMERGAMPRVDLK